MNRILKSKYKVEEKIADTSSHVTYKGSMVDSTKEIAIKIYKKDYLNTFLVKTLKKQVDYLSKLESPMIAKLIDGDYGWQGFYFIREYIDGEVLSNIKTPVPVEKAVEIIISVCDAVKNAHEKGFVHGSITPNNIFVLTNNWKVKVADFGIRKAVSEPVEQRAKWLFDPSSIFSAPEVLLGEDSTIKSDIYQIGLVLAYLLSDGKNIPSDPFKFVEDILTNNNKQHPFALTKIPKHIEDIINLCLEKDPLLRFASVQEIAEHLSSKSSPRKKQNFLDIMQIDLALESSDEISKEQENEIEKPKVPPEESIDKNSDIGLFKKDIENEERNAKINFINWPIILILIAVLAGILYSFVVIFFLGE